MKTINVNKACWWHNY